MRAAAMRGLRCGRARACTVSACTSSALLPPHLPQLASAARRPASACWQVHASSSGTAAAARLLSRLIPADDAALVMLQPADGVASPSCARASELSAPRRVAGFERSEPRHRHAAHRELQQDGYKHNKEHGNAGKVLQSSAAGRQRTPLAFACNAAAHTRCSEPALLRPARAA